MAGLQREAADHNAAMGTQMTERFSAPGATLVKLFGRPSDESAEFAARADRVRDIGIRTAMAQSAFITALTLVSALALALVYGLGGYYALRGSLEPGAVVALALLLTRLYAPLTALAGARVEVMSALVSFERVFEILDLKPLIEEKPDARRVPEGPVSVEFDQVSFGYPSAEKVSLASLEEVATLDDRGGTPVLHEVSFRAEPGQMIALVGSSGAGKSTIAQLLPRLYDTDAGTVRLNGVDVRDLSADSIRDTLGMVTQDGHLFHESVRANLLLARPDASEEDVWDALRRSRLDGLIASLPDGLDTVVGERGYRLSGGERQRLTIARLLLARQRVVILDEATAHLDSTSEAAVQEALAEALAGRTALVIAHRLSTVRAADRILVVEAGRIVENGTHTELLAAAWEVRGAVPHPVRAAVVGREQAGPAGPAGPLTRAPAPHAVRPDLIGRTASAHADTCEGDPFGGPQPPQRVAAAPAPLLGRHPRTVRAVGDERVHRRHRVRRHGLGQQHTDHERDQRDGQGRACGGDVLDAGAVRRFGGHAVIEQRPGDRNIGKRTQGHGTRILRRSRGTLTAAGYTDPGLPPDHGRIASMGERQGLGDSGEPRGGQGLPDAASGRGRPAAAVFDALGAEYERAFAASAAHRESLERLLADLAPGSRVLDVGSGTGRPTARTLADAGHRVLGVDVSPVMTALAARQVPTAEFRCADARDLPCPRASSTRSVCTSRYCRWSAESSASWWSGSCGRCGPVGCWSPRRCRWTPRTSTRCSWGSRSGSPASAPRSSPP